MCHDLHHACRSWAFCFLEAKNLQLFRCRQTLDAAQGINGNKMEKACDLCHITLNKNAVVGDVSALAPGGVRVGAPAMTSRGLVEADFEKIADFLHELVQLCLDIQSKTGKLYKEFEKCDTSSPCFGVQGKDVVLGTVLRSVPWSVRGTRPLECSSCCQVLTGFAHRQVDGANPCLGSERLEVPS